MMERFKQADKDGDGKLSREEAPDKLKENFDRLDTNKDGFIDATEMARFFERLRQNRPQEGSRPRRRPQQEENKPDK